MGSVFDPKGIITCIQLDNKFYWFRFAHGLVYPILAAVCGRMGQDKIGKPIKKMMKIVLKRVQQAKVKFYRDGEEGREVLGMENCSIIICDGSELELADPRKEVYVLQTVFQYFYYLVF